MRELFEPPLAPQISTGNLSDHVEYNARAHPEHAVFATASDAGWNPISSVHFRNQVRGVAKGLIADGIATGDRIAIFARTVYEWSVVDYAIWYAGAISVPIYETSSPEQIEWMMSDANVVATFFETNRNVVSFNEVAERLPKMTNRYVFSEGALADLTTRGQEISDEVLEQRRTKATPEDIATIIYTSGTTGRPKGCMLTHGNFMAECDNLIQILPEVFGTPEASTLLFLPLAHVFGRMIELAMFRGRVTIGHCPNPTALLKQLQSFKPTFLLAVPRVFEKVYNTAGTNAQKESPIKGRIFDKAAAVAIAYSKATENGKASLILKFQHSLFDKLVYSKLRTAMGGRVTHAISGGASLGARLGHFYRGLGIMILEGYGMTETTAGATVNRPQALKIGTVGKPVPGTCVRIADDGEVLLRGHHIFKGYWNNEAATAELLGEDGWLHSGDIGELDSAGFLRITGRKKELIVTAGGKNVAPAVLEDRLRAHPLISQCVVVGDALPYIAALVTLDEDALPAILEANKIAKEPMAQLVTSKEVRALVQQAVNDANKAVSNSEAIKKFVILPHDLTIDNGYLTPKLSIRRHLITVDFAGQIASMYR